MLLPLLSLAILPLAAAQQACRCLYGQSCWPGKPDFDVLASQLTQPLLFPVPPESSCYPVSNLSSDCSAVVQNHAIGNWRADQPGAMQNTNFETFIFDNGTISACYLNTTLGFPCEQGSVPVIGVDARSVKDVQVAIRFASKHNLRLVVKNTGHDLLGRSTARGAFMIWTHHLKNITIHDSFTPVGGLPSEKYQAITLGSGVQWHEAYDAVQAHGRMMVGGLATNASIGAAGGWILGGGHSVLSPRHGLGVDNVLQFTIILASGKHITTNAHRNTDLFWALRGGGGGTYGILTSVTYRTYPSVPLIGTFFMANFSSSDIALQVLAEHIRTQPPLVEAGWGGYTLISNGSMQSFLIAPNVSWSDANATIDPFFSFARNATSGGPPIETFTLPFDSYYAWYRFIFQVDNQAGQNVELSSRLIPQDVVQQNYTVAAETVLSIDQSLYWNIVAGGAVSKVDPDSTGINPAWRRALAHVVIYGYWDEGQPLPVINEVRSKLKANEALLAAITPGSGAYYNEASLYEEDFKQTFFGSHYARLKAIKERYDPHGLFVVSEGVGSDEWDSSLNCRR